MNKTIVVSVTVVSLAALVAFAVYVNRTPYTAVSAGNGLVYRVDNRTGGVVRIRGAVATPVGETEEEGREAPARNLKTTELARVKGLARESGGEWIGTVYNGNATITLTTLKIAVTATVNGKSTSRKYLVDVNVKPWTVESFRFRAFYDGNFDPEHFLETEHSWSFAGVVGRPGS